MNELQKLEKFFKENLYIKNTLNDLAPKEEDFYSIESRVKYFDKLYNTQKDLKNDFIIINDLLNLNLGDQIRGVFDKINKNMLNVTNNINDIRNAYKLCFSDMNEKLIEDVKNECKGYYIHKDNDKLFSNCNTINELLHVIHSYVINDEKTYEKIPVAYEGKKGNSKMIIYGNIENYSLVNYIAVNLYNKFYNEYNDSLQIMPIDNSNKIIMMFRNRGHALSIEIDVTDKDLTVNYYIPKICNLEMVNNLRGVNKINELNNNTTGKFITTKENITKELFDFVTSVPTDFDMKDDYSRIM